MNLHFHTLTLVRLTYLSWISVDEESIRNVGFGDHCFFQQRQNRLHGNQFSRLQWEMPFSAYFPMAVPEAVKRKSFSYCRFIDTTYRKES